MLIMTSCWVLFWEASLSAELACRLTSLHPLQQASTTQTGDLQKMKVCGWREICTLIKMGFLSTNFRHMQIYSCMLCTDTTVTSLLLLHTEWPSRDLWWWCDIIIRQHMVLHVRGDPKAKVTNVEEGNLNVNADTHGSKKKTIYYC